jgi:hypothetical protein
MKRINEKVKDLVEVRSYKNLQNYYSNPAETFAAYHFTDTTSDMMSKWLDKLADVQVENGYSLALAGYRGVGKSHFLATLGAIAAQPELRSRIADSHVAAATQRLKRRRYPVAFVRRGLLPTFLDELKDSISTALSINKENLSDSLPELLKMVSESADDVPFVLIIDTAFERTSRVSRNDGEVLGEIAAIAAKLNLFVGVALDDDIAGADGVNLAIARSYLIDYLDQEHLYRIVNSHVFPKSRQNQPLVHDIYNNFREILPNFRWSEQRFSSLYPLHPVILEIAPYIRLYAPDFALLGFASDAGSKILGRPANSLIALDEVFDCVEGDLRKVDDLSETFAAYDRLNSEVVSGIPVMQRLQAKLILKGLFLLSLDGNGTSAGEISAAMLIFDENNPQRGLKMVEDLLETFVSVLPEQIQRRTEEGRDIRYSLKVSLTDDLNKVLSEKITTVSPQIIPKMFRKIARDRFTDWNFGDESNDGEGDWMDSQIVWRGGFRRGRVCWSLESESVGAKNKAVNREFIDWTVIISGEAENSEQNPQKTDISTIYWYHAPLKKDEIETILRYYLLLNDYELRSEFDDQIRTVGHSHTVAIEKIWKRIFLEDGKMVIDGFDYNFTEEARNTQSLTEIFTIMLEPFFEMQYPLHPQFTQTLGMTEVASLVNDLFSGTRQNLPQVQHLAEVFALPLGLAVQRGEIIVPETEDKILELPLAKEVLDLVKSSSGESVSLKTVYQSLKKPPIGLVREAQHLILTALVANRKIEFVTSKGDRINRRSLDLKIIWDDIVGIAQPLAAIYSSERLAEWVKILTGVENLKSLESNEERASAAEAMKVWLEDWKKTRILERFTELPDEILTTKIWRLSILAEKTFGSVSAAVAGVLDNSITLEEGLHRTADAFSNSEAEFFQRTQDLVVLEDFISGTKRRGEINSYLAVSENTQDIKIEFFREKLQKVIEETIINPNQMLNREMENLWQSFHTRFSEHFAVKHDMVMKSHHLQEKFDEILRSDEWWEFENLSKLPIFPNYYWREAQKIRRQFKELDCGFSVREMLQTHPFCACSFNLAQIREWENLPNKMLEIISNGLASYRKILLNLSATITQIVSHFANKKIDDEYSKASLHLVKIFREARNMPPLNNAELIILQKAFENLPTSLFYTSSVPKTADFISRREIKEQINLWLNELPEEPVLVKI